jgi:hypothetical protein
MKRNVGTVDRTIRIVLGIGLVVAGFFLGGAAAVLCFTAGAVVLLTGLLGWCGLYTLLKMNTCSVKK